MIAVLCVRRFQLKREGVASLLNLARVVELPLPPAREWTLDFADGTGSATIQAVTLVAGRSWEPGTHPPAVHVRMSTEPAGEREERLEEAKAAGWTLLEPSP